MSLSTVQLQILVNKLKYNKYISTTNSIKSLKFSQYGNTTIVGVIMQKVLLLDNHNRPINICSWKRALVLLLKGKAENARHLNDIDSMIKVDNILIPYVIKLTYDLAVLYKELPFCRENILVRDEFVCQYCGKKFPAEELTLDHVFPKSRLGPDIWENIVACCKECNQKKADRTPKEARMKLLRRPYRPTDYLRFELKKYPEHVVKNWLDYFEAS